MYVQRIRQLRLQLEVQEEVRRDCVEIVFGAAERPLCVLILRIYFRGHEMLQMYKKEQRGGDGNKNRNTSLGNST